MMKILICTCALLVQIVPMKHALHMFQQNRYELTRYTTWLKQNTFSLLKENIVYLVLTVLLFIVSAFFSSFVSNITTIFFFLFLFFNFFKMEKNKNYIKPLVYTGRVKRQIAVAFVLSLLFYIFVFYSVDDHYILLISLLSICGPWILVYLISFITTPIEKTVQKYYMNDAKNILKKYNHLKIVGITGSFGKTSTKNVVKAVISQKYNTLMTPHSYNTPMGITRTIREMLKPIHEVFVCEMGADKVGDIEELMNFVHPQVGIVTSIGPQHLQTFGSQENIIKEKMQMIEKLPKNGVGILNIDNKFIENYNVKNSVEIITYGIRNQNADYYAKNIEYKQNGSVFTVVHGNEEYEFTTKLLGELNILNILAAIACARFFDVSWDLIKKGVHEMKQVEHRLELKKINGFTFIDDAFNANPNGARAAVTVLGRFPNKRVVVTPGMIDLGVKQYEVNYQFGKDMIHNVDFVILVGKEQTEPIYNGLIENGFNKDYILIVANVKEAFSYIYRNASFQDTILLENDLPDAFSK